MTRILNILRHNWLQKIIALVAAFFMWIFVMEDQDPAIDGSYSVPLTMSNAPYEFIAICDEKTVTLKTRAPRSYFVRYDANAFRVYANLDGMDEGTHRIIPQVVMPQGFELLETTPAAVNVTLDPLIERQIEVELKTNGTVAQDAAIKSVDKSMDIVTLVGPKSFVEQVDKVYGTVNLSGNSSSFDMQIPMNAVDAEGNAVPRVHVVPSVITVSVDIESGLRHKIVPVIANLTTTDGWELTKITVEPAQMEITGVESVINPIVTLRTVPFTVQTGQRVFKGTLKLDVPEGVTVPNDEVTVTASVIRKPVMRDTAER
ncbi:MAG: hypothetical protein SR1Q7_08205 [Quinella sp. 1Q7]|nr:hypothetical protein [Quinella sp. 1Q7]